MKSTVHFITQFYKVIATEFRFIFKDPGVMLILLGAIFIYSFLYSMAYKNQVLFKVPVAVVDNSQSPASRELVRMLNASPNLEVVRSAQGLDDAKDMFYKRAVYGVILIPDDYQQNILKGKIAKVSIYADASYILIYKQTLYGAVNTIASKSSSIEQERFMQGGASNVQAKALSDPIVYSSSFLFNRFAGYATFVMPAVMLLIMQQTLLIGIGMIGGTWQERKLYAKLVPLSRTDSRINLFSVVLGKAAVYLLIYAVIALYICHVHYRIFGYPMRGDNVEMAIFLLPYFLSAIFLGITLSTIFNTREESILVLLFSSIPLLILSGVTWPKESIPAWMNFVGNIVPSNNGVPGFIRLQIMGGKLSDVMTNFWILWGLTGVYFVTALLGMRRAIRKAGESI